MAEGLGRHKLIEVEGGHETLFTDPKVVADGLLKTVK
jgi:hypothetical protein